MFRTIWSKSLRDYRVPILCWGLGLGLLMLIEFAASTPAIMSAYAAVAPGLRFLGDPVAITTPEGYVTARLMEVFLPLILCIWPILVGARLVRGEEERGTMDVLLATPQPRVRVLLEKVSMLIIALLIIGVLIGLGMAAGEAALKIQVDLTRALLAALNASLLAFFFATVALLISQFTQNRGAAAGWTSGLLILAFLLDATGRSVDGTWVQYLSPFYYYNLNRPLIASFGDTPLAALLLGGLALLFIIISLILFAQRDSGRAAFAFQRNQKDNNHLIERSLRKARRNLSLRGIWVRALGTQSWMAFWWLLGIVLYTGWGVLLLPSIQQPFQKAFRETPILAKLFSDANFLGIVVFTFAPILVAAFALTLALNWAVDLENGRLELLLGTPNTRQRMMLERFGAIFLLTLLAPVLTWLAILVGAQVANLTIDQNKVMAASLSLFPLALVIIGLVYALAGRMRYAVVLGLLSLYITGAYLLEFLKALFKLPGWVMDLSIFHQYGNPIVDGMNWPAFLGMTGVALVLLLIGLVQFRISDVERG